MALGSFRTETSISALEFRCSFVGTLHATNFRGRVSLPGAFASGPAVVEFRCWLGFGEFGRLENVIVGFKGVGKAFGVGLVLVKGGMVGLKSEKGEM